MENLTVLVPKPTFAEAEEVLQGIAKIEVLCAPKQLPKELQAELKHFIKKRKQTVFVQASAYFMALIIWECKKHSIPCRAYKHN